MLFDENLYCATWRPTPKVVCGLPPSLSDCCVPTVMRGFVESDERVDSMGWGPWSAGSRIVNSYVVCSELVVEGRECQPSVWI